MIKVSSIVSIIVLGLGIIVIGAAIGMLYEGSFQGVIILDKNPIGSIDNNSNASSDCSLFKKVVDDMSSKVIASITAYGQVTFIDGNNITLKRSEDTITFKIKDGTLVRSLNTNAATKEKNITLKDIKVGDTINITLRLLPDGTFESVSILKL